MTAALAAGADIAFLEAPPVPQRVRGPCLANLSAVKNAEAADTGGQLLAAE